MSCALHRGEPGKYSYPAKVSEAHSDLCAEMANGLHTLAQPLTILRGALGALMGPGGKDRDHRRYLEMSVSQIERMCDLMAQMQRLVDTHQFEADLATLDLATLINSIVEDMDGVMRGLGIELSVAIPEKGLAVAADRERTTQAVQSILKASASISTPGDVIRLSALPRDGIVEVTIENENGHRRTFNTSERLSLSLAEASIRSQHGNYRCRENSISITLALTAQNAKRIEHQTEGRNSLSPGVFAPASQFSH